MIINAKDAFTLLLLAAIWGASFLFIKVAVGVLGPVVLMFLRVAIASTALALYVFLRRGHLSIRKWWKQYLLLGLINAAIPFTFISIAELHLSASLAAVLNATTPLFTALVAWIWLKDAMTVKKLLGLVMGVVGVAVLVGWTPGESTLGLLVPASFSLLAAVSYAFGGVYSSVAFKGANSMDMAVGQQVGASLVMLPVAAATLHSSTLSPGVVLAVLGLSVLCTAFAYLLYFALIANVGPVKALSVTFLVPIFGVLWGFLFLHEPVSINLIIGLCIILASVLLVVRKGSVRKTGRLREEA